MAPFGFGSRYLEHNPDFPVSIQKVAPNYYAQYLANSGGISKLYVEIWLYKNFWTAKNLMKW